MYLTNFIKFKCIGLPHLDFFVCFSGWTYILWAFMAVAVATVAEAKIVMKISADKVGEGFQKPLLVTFKEIIRKKFEDRRSGDVLKHIYDVGMSDFDRFLYESNVRGESPIRVLYDSPQALDF